ncbi:hypothetical protein ABLE91_18605 [Aquabacter sp. CN5-332]|uniref:hypothetical protein n=1 Tax=Aquabacter sp. CN5-332 TaxID=3156608 RepID=UPI0032B39F1D
MALATISIAVASSAAAAASHAATTTAACTATYSAVTAPSRPGTTRTSCGFAAATGEKPLAIAGSASLADTRIAVGSEGLGVQRKRHCQHHHPGQEGRRGQVHGSLAEEADAGLVSDTDENAARHSRIWLPIGAPEPHQHLSAPQINPSREYARNLNKKGGVIIPPLTV